jgi:hypothetical protein
MPFATICTKDDDFIDDVLSPTPSSDALETCLSTRRRRRVTRCTCLSRRDVVVTGNRTIISNDEHAPSVGGIVSDAALQLRCSCGNRGAGYASVPWTRSDIECLSVQTMPEYSTRVHCVEIFFQRTATRRSDITFYAGPRGHGDQEQKASCLTFGYFSS